MRDWGMLRQLIWGLGYRLTVVIGGLGYGMTVDIAGLGKVNQSIWTGL
jgi:hypothetical protein